jgi:hypothetical protein
MRWVPLRTGYGQRSDPRIVTAWRGHLLELKPFPDVLPMGVSFREVTLRYS